MSRAGPTPGSADEEGARGTAIARALRRAAPALGASALYAALTVAMTWPLPAQLRVMEAGDPAFFTWAVGWTVHALRTDPLRLPHGNMFHPLRDTLFLDEPVLGTTLLVLPLAAFTEDAVLLHNVARLLTFVASAFAAWALCRSLGLSGLPALAGGAFFAFSPIRTDQIGHLSTLGTQWLPVVVLFALRFFRDGAWRDALLAAAAFALSAYACGYHGLVALLVLPVAFLPALWGRWSLLPRAFVAAGVAGLLLLPLYTLHRRALDPHGYVRQEGETIRYSASLETFAATHSWNRVWGEATARFRTVESNNLFAGVTVTTLAGAALVSGLRRRGNRRTAAVFGALALASAAVALGPEVRALGHALGPGPFALARELPVFQMIRVPSRAGIFLALALAVLAAMALQRLGARLPLVVLLSAAGVAEAVIAPIPTPAWAQVIRSDAPPPPVYDWLAAQPAGTVVAELPLLGFEAITSRPSAHESVYLVRSTRHFQPLVNGYAGLEPRAYTHLRTLCRRFPETPCLLALAAHRTQVIVVHRADFGALRWANRVGPALERAARQDARPRLREIARFGDDLVYALEP